MASPTIFNPTPTLPALITNPPTAQFTPGPGCIDPDDHWVVVTSCAAFAIGENYDLYPSSPWLTCQLTQFGPPENAPASCFEPYSAQTIVGAETTYYSGCPSGYTDASVGSFSRSDGLETEYYGYCCPTQYNFNVENLSTGGDYMEFTTERDGISYDVGYPLPGCATSYISELSGQEIAVQTDFNTYGWEKRQVANVPWDYEYGTMYAEAQYYSYTVFYSTHTCYQDCNGWYEYYFSGSSEPPFTVVDTGPATTTPVDAPTTTSSEGDVETPPPPPPPPVEETSQSEVPFSTSSIEISSTFSTEIPVPSSVAETGEPSSTTEDAQTTPSPTGKGSPTSTILILPTLTLTPSVSSGNTSVSFTSSSLPSSTTLSVPTGAAASTAPTRLVLLGLVVLLIAL
ncbi:hypothetical protein F4678DRAFT_56127 [Xylaria arbuscula]|nr:hypothetical protein F4678DRAFT_56127 [Xylaria arbuscula]